MSADADLVVETIEQVASATGFSGAVRVDLADGTVVELAYGLADRRWGIPFETTTRAAIASGTKSFTALAVLALVDAEVLTLDTTARSLLGGDLALIDDRVTVEQLLAHRSGIGDYLDESAIADITDHVMTVPVHLLDGPEAYLPALDGHPQVSEPGTTFAYNNAGFVLLALLAERAARRPYAALVDELVCRPAGLTDTAFDRSDSPAPGVATGYLHGDRHEQRLRTNALHLPVVGVGDGGLVSTVADVRRLWRAFFDGAIVAAPTRDLAVAPHSHVPDEDARYGLGFWLHPSGPAVRMEGYDAGISFRSWHDPVSELSHTVVANTPSGAWPVTAAIAELLAP